MNRRREHSYPQWKSANGWEYVDGTWKWKKSPKTEAKATISEEAQKLGFWEYAEWSYVEVIADKRGYLQDLLGETDAQFSEKKRFSERARWKEAGITTDVNTGAVE